MGRPSKISVGIISAVIGKTPEEIANSFVFDEAYCLAKKGIDVHVIRRRVEGKALSYRIHFHGLERKVDARAVESMLENLRVYPPVSLLRNPARIYWENVYAVNVSKVIEENKIDLIHAHFAYPEGLAGLLAKRKTERPLILTSHGWDLNVIKEYNYGRRLQRRYDALIRRIVQESDHIIVPSNLLYKRSLEIGVADSKISIIPDAVDTSIFHPGLNGSLFRKKYGLGNEPIILTIRSLTLHYRVDKVIKVAKMMPEKIRCKFVIIGGGEERDKLVSLAGELINKRIYFIGRVPHTEIPQATAAADIVFDPCPIGQGINVLEAMACAKPVIGIDTRDLWDYVVDGETGFLVNFNDEQTIAEKIIYLIQKMEESKRMGMKGRKIVEEKYNIDKRSNQIISLYNSLLGRGAVS